MINRYGIKRYAQTLSLTHGASVTTVSNTSQKFNGELWQVNTLTPAAVDSSATATINIIDADGCTVYTKGSLAANTGAQSPQMLFADHANCGRTGADRMSLRAGRPSEGTGSPGISHQPSLM